MLLEHRGRRPVEVEVVDGLPRIVPFGLREQFNKQMTRTMEAFSEIVHVNDRLPIFKMKVEPDDKPEVTWVAGGSFAFALTNGKSLPILVDAENIFGTDTSFQSALTFESNRSGAWCVAPPGRCRLERGGRPA